MTATSRSRLDRAPWSGGFLLEGHAVPTIVNLTGGPMAGRHVLPSTTASQQLLRVSMCERGDSTDAYTIQTVARFGSKVVIRGIWHEDLAVAKAAEARGRAQEGRGDRFRARTIFGD